MYILNLILPTFLLFSFVWWIAIVAIVGNFIIDAGIYRWYLSSFRGTYLYQWKYIWRAYGLGFLADFIGAGVLILLYSVPNSHINYFYIFDTWYNTLVHIVVVAMTGIILFYFNKINLKKSGLEESDINKLSLIMAIVTAPYTFLIPASVFGW
jgi:hypothetical protein